MDKAIKTLCDQASILLAEHTDLTIKTSLLLIYIADRGFRIQPEDGLNNEFFFADFRGDELALCGMGMENDEPVVYGICTQGVNQHTESIVPLKYINRDDRLFLLQYIQTIKGKNLI